MKKTKIEKLFGEYVCSDEVLKKYMPKGAYKKYLSIKEKGDALDTNTAKFVAKAIKDWSLKMGATHYSHWFMPLTNKTAEKQVSFIEIDANGKLIEDFSAKSLIKGETDASSFPNGGERVTFEARGYTVWDYTSPVFIKEDSAKNKVVYIPTAFCSYNGTALDDKTPLLRSIENLNTQALRVLKNLGYNDVKKVNFYIGAEQEYFLVRTEDYNKRIDLKMTGRTLLGAKPLMSQEQCSHYFGMIEDNISKFMNEIDTVLWKMGITAKLQHNEVAPAQHEFVPIFNLVNLSCDQNQLIMEVISRVAKKYGLTALFHEKPFEYINGSGKHANWSLSTDTGMNLFDTKLKDRTLFYTFFVAMVCAIDRYYKLIRLSTAYRSNDLRLGGDEAPPALISVFASDYVLDLLSDIEKTTNTKNAKNVLDMGVKSLPKTEKDFCDRNRTSPFAFSGNKFEFRMVGSSQSVAWPSTCICTIFSKILCEIADELDKTTTNKKEKVIEYLKEKLSAHKRIIFNGNGYDDAWKKEAKSRGLVEYKDSLSVYKILDDEDIIEVFESTKVLNKNELSMRKSTLIKNYIQTVLLEARTLNEMLNKEIFPSLNNCINNFSLLLNNSEARVEFVNCINDSLNKLYLLNKKLTKNIEKAEKTIEIDKKIDFVMQLLENLKEIRKEYDNTESLLPNSFEPFPTYNDILF